MELLSEIPEGASATVIENLDAETRRQIFLFGLRVEIIGYMVFHGMVDVQTVNDLARGAILGFWSRAKDWAMARRKRTGHDEFLEWCEWLATQIAQYRPRDLMFRLTRGRHDPLRDEIALMNWDELGNARSDRAIGGGVRRNPFAHLLIN